MRILGVKGSALDENDDVGAKRAFSQGHAVSSMTNLLELKTIRAEMETLGFYAASTSATRMDSPRER